MIYLEETDNIINVLVEESTEAVIVYKIDLTHTQTNNLYPIIISDFITNDTYTQLSFNLNGDYDEGEYKYEIYRNDVLIDTGLAYFKWSDSSIISKTYNKNINRKIYGREN